MSYICFFGFQCPSTIICLLVRHHRKTKMETHQITDLLHTFPNQTKKSTLFLGGEFQCPGYLKFCFRWGVFVFISGIWLKRPPWLNPKRQRSNISNPPRRSFIHSSGNVLSIRLGQTRWVRLGWEGAKVPRCRCPMAGVVAPPKRTRLNHVKSHSQRVMNHEADRIVP